MRISKVLHALRAFRAMRTDLPHNYVAADLIGLNDNGAWSWFSDERAIVANGKLIVGSVRAVGNFSQAADPNWGNVELSVYDLEAGGASKVVVLNRHFEQDDHDTPAFLRRQDGRILAVYAGHGIDTAVRYRISEPDDPLAWAEERSLISPGMATEPGTADGVTYANLFQTSLGVINIYRGYGQDPNWMASEDGGATWRYGGRIFKGGDGYSSYQKWAFDGDGDTIHFVTTEDHPRHRDNSLYHGFIRDGKLHRSDGTEIGGLSRSVDTDLAAWDFTKLFQGDPDNAAWIIDLKLDAKKRPVAVFSVQKDGRGMPRGLGGMDHRYHYAWWDGEAWHSSEMAHAGRRLYAGEDDYTGLAAIDPRNANVVYISTDADPVTGVALFSKADLKRHYEIFRGERSPQETWRWTPITANSDADNLRPIAPSWDDCRTILVWMRGRYLHNHGEWTTKVVMTILPNERECRDRFVRTR